MRHKLNILVGKTVKKAAKLRGGGSALPGLVVEKLDSKFAQKALSQLPKGVVVISGTNGKTTTTKMVVSLLESQGLKVFTNKTGSNFSRGVSAEILGQISSSGKLSADIAVLELDEAHAVQFVKNVKPTYSLLLNVLRDQLDRFGELDKVAKLLERIASETSDKVVLNREDAHILKISKSIGDKSVFYGLDESLLKLFPNDEDLHENSGTDPQTDTDTISKKPSAKVILNKISDNNAEFVLNEKKFATTMELNGAYNLFNAAGALALVSTILPEAKHQDLIEAISGVTPAFGRGESIQVGSDKLDIVLVKNPAGFKLGLSSFDNTDREVMISINDNYADGRDVSWLWDVDFSSLKNVHTVSGSRAFDMALRLEADKIAINRVNNDLTNDLHDFISKTKGRNKRIYTTYTAMLAIRKELSKITKVEDI